MRMGNKPMDILNLWQILLWYMNQLWTRHLIGNMWRAVLLWRCIFILIAVFLKKKKDKKKDQSTTEMWKNYPENLGQK